MTDRPVLSDLSRSEDADGLRFDSRDDALDFGRRSVEEANRWFAHQMSARESDIEVRIQF